MAFKVPEKYRVVSGPMKSTVLDGNNGLFFIKMGQVQVACVASDGMDWEHVSVSLNVKRCPDWEEMCAVKDLFCGKDDCVVQYHPPEKEYVNNHPYCLHLWRPIGSEIRTPPSILVGYK